MKIIKNIVTPNPATEAPEFMQQINNFYQFLL